MAVHYQVRLKGTDGLVDAVFEDTGGFVSLQYSHKVNGISAFELVLRGDDPRIPLFVPDAQVEIWRRHQLLDLDWYPEFEGLVRAPVVKVPLDGRETFHVNGQSYTDFLRRRVIAYTQGSVGAQKTGPAETVMKAYVKENLGSLATLGNGRQSAGVMPGLAVQADLALGSTWTGDRSFEKLPKVLQEIASASGLDFDIVGTGAGLFGFRTYVGQRGTDRSTLGLDTFTARNGVGNTPVIFSIENETMVDAVYSLNRTDEVNRYFILGQGQGSIRQITVSDDVALQDDSPWNLCEDSKNAVREGDVTSLPLVGSAALAQAKIRKEFSFKVLQQPEQLYGKHYTWGDKITADFQGVETHLKIVGMTGAFAEGGERIELEFAEVG
jgi:hypothetical protein